MWLVCVRSSVLGKTASHGAIAVNRRFAAAQAHGPSLAGPAKAVSGTSGCTDGGVRYYAARSVPAPESSVCFVVAEQLNQFAVVDGGAGPCGAACATFCAQRLPRLISRAFVERLHYTPLESATDPISGIRLKPTEAAAAAWSDALAAGFAECDRAAVQEESLSAGYCGGLFCAVARSGVYIASVGLGRAVVGTEEDAGSALLCDEVSSPHNADSAVEARRWAAAGGGQEEQLPRPDTPTRQLGGAAARREEPRLIALPDVVRQRHAEGRRYVILGSPGVWVQGPEQPLHAAAEAYRRGRSPADAVLEQSEGDAAAVVLVLPGGLGGESCMLPEHGRLSHG